MKDPTGVGSGPEDPELAYTQPWLSLKEPANPYTEHHHERTERFLQPLAPVIAQDLETITRMRAFERRQPSYQTDGGEVYTHRRTGSATTKLVFRGRDGRERVLVENFKPSMEYPDVYPNGFWLSPDGRHVIYSDADPVHEGGAVLHTVRTDTGAQVGTPLRQAQYPSGSWIDNKRFVFALRGTGKVRPWATHWATYLRHVDDDGTLRDVPLPEIARAEGDSRYDFTPGPAPGTVTVLGYNAILNTPQTIKVFDLDGKGRGFAVQRESEGSVGRVRLGPAESDGSRRMFVLRSDRRSRRSGRVVVVDPSGKPHGRPRFRQLVAGRRGDVIREIEVIDRGAGRPPSLALSIRRHGGEVRVDIVDLKKSAGWRGGLKAAKRWTVPLPGAQEVRSHRNHGKGKGKDRIRGWYGTISAMTATRGDGGGGLDIEYAARESVPHRLYRLAAPTPGAVPRQVAGPTTREARAAGVPRVDVTLHRPRAGLLHRTSLHVVRPANAPRNRPVPQVYTAYPYYNLGGHNQNFTPFAATIVAKDIAWISHSVYGTGAQGYDELLGPRAKARRKALKEMRTALRYLDNVPGLAGAEQRTGFFQSAGGMIGLDALRHAPESFRNIFFNRTRMSVLNGSNQRVHMNVDDARDRRAGYAHSGGIAEAVRKPPENVVYTLGSSDPRIPDYTVRMTAAAFDEARTRYFGDKTKTPGGTYLIEQHASGHFPGGNEQSTIAAVVGRLAGRHPAPRPQPNSATAPDIPTAVVPPNTSAPLPATPHPTSPRHTARNSVDTGLGQPGTAHTFGSGMENAAALAATPGLSSAPRLRTMARRLSAASRRVTDPHGDRAAIRETVTRRKTVEETVPKLVRGKSKSP